ncbi:carbamoyltransferase HypF [Stackebrandtia nassauensis]|uniref:Carbamoyltransferase n=1 Tax=Stackebrandtia nassauensis (strain DSM 44728 / CIP 108903 / NRRL B-16338 / NBRC 102104 / LLR-40K-21) TaxID=446470 RepID=D3PVJ6_STANL|nr:carbamoyltransferase HypF [Stackebrandtia nassauensis]ADD43110.1 (NiFe) hydrogenase maturation protein HypF [Stackebrandtia nassauensis DSM 44728]
MTPARLRGVRAVRVTVSGLVQGVGFRPFVYRLANEHRLNGHVANTGGQVAITARGPAAALAEFIARLSTEAPVQSHVENVAVADLEPTPGPGAGFRIVNSARSGDPRRYPPPDLATCAACARELFDPDDRRYRYPFINCTACGPRISIIDDLPYDRARTTMRTFHMCDRCRGEYLDPGDRRFHAEPIACADCGPRLTWWGDGIGHGEAALSQAIAVLETGGLIAMKGVGGYQLVTDAGDDTAVRRLRHVKNRPGKPLAVMVGTLDRARRLADLDTDEAKLLTAPAAPIVVCHSPHLETLSSLVAPRLSHVGVFLPYSPLHHLLLAALDRPLVVTSGNLGGEPIIIGDEAARDRLGPMVDGVLGHDRPIRERHDDSVVRVVDGETLTLRRARGYAPSPSRLPIPTDRTILAAGAQSKSALAVTGDDRVILGPYLGDLDSAEAMDGYATGVDRLCGMHAVQPNLIAHDLHDGYASTRFARDSGLDRVGVQHHHAHVVATAAERGVDEPFIGVAYDGLGMGDDGTLWGGEIMLADYRDFRRLGRFGYAPLPGGAAAIRNPARMALGYRYGAEDLGGGTFRAPELEKRLGPAQTDTIRRMIERGVNCPKASSAGRLFDAVAALLGITDTSSYEGEAAVLLEAACEGVADAFPLPWRLARRDGIAVYDPIPTLRAITETDEATSLTAARFHTTIVEVTVALVRDAARHGYPKTVCLGGGVFQNRRLVRGVREALGQEGFTVHISRDIPVNDGGIAYGQAVIAAARSTRR